MKKELLAPALVWQESGHLTEEAVVLLADGSDSALPPEAAAHGWACDECALRLGHAAVMSASVGTALGEVYSEAATAPSSSAARVPPPFWALALGLVFAGVGAIPFLLQTPGWLLRAGLILERCVPVFAHSVVASTGGASERALVTAVSLAVVLMSLLCVSRLTPREGIPQ